MEEGTSWTDRPSRDPWQLLCKLASEMSLSSFPESGGHPALSKLEAAMGAVKWEGGTPPWRQGPWPGWRFQSLGACCGSKAEAGRTLSWGLHTVPRPSRERGSIQAGGPAPPGCRLETGSLAPTPDPENQRQVVQPAGCVSACPPASLRHTRCVHR